VGAMSRDIPVVLMDRRPCDIPQGHRRPADDLEANLEGLHQDAFLILAGTIGVPDSCCDQGKPGNGESRCRQTHRRNGTGRSSAHTHMSAL
jgi:hypothetical protein